MYNLVQIFYMRTIDEWLTLYGRDHQNPTNKLIHWICVPVILFTVFEGRYHDEYANQR